MLIRLGLMWTTNELPPGQEHFISNLIRQKICTAIDSLPPAVANSQKWLLFLPENEFHDLGLLFSNYLIRQSGKQGHLSWCEYSAAVAYRSYRTDEAGSFTFLFSAQQFF